MSTPWIKHLIATGLMAGSLVCAVPQNAVAQDENPAPTTTEIKKTETTAQPAPTDTQKTVIKKETQPDGTEVKKVKKINSDGSEFKKTTIKQVETPEDHAP